MRGRCRSGRLAVGFAAAMLGLMAPAYPQSSDGEAQMAMPFGDPMGSPQFFSHAMLDQFEERIGDGHDDLRWDGEAWAGSVANRGEIAVRVMRAASELEIPTVAIYSQEDRFGLHRTKADEAYLVGEGKGAIEAYLDIPDILRVAREARCRCDSSGLRLPVGEPGVRRGLRRGRRHLHRPEPETMRVLGNKVAARNLAVAAGVPVMPATPPLPATMAECRRLAGRSAIRSCSRPAGAAAGAACA
jgi:hypothetical protein